MSRVHGPVVAGMFYSLRSDALRSEVEGFLADAVTHDLGGRLVGLIVPHAGYTYSGPIAASGYAHVAGLDIGDVVAVGPSHFSWFSGLASLDAEAWRTPLGDVVVNPCDEPPAARMFEPYSREHCLEVQLPFLQVVAPGAALTPLLTGDIHPGEVAALLGDLVAGRLLVISSDLSHYLDHTSAQRIDRATADAIVGLEPDALRPDSACGRTGIQAALILARDSGWRVVELDLRTSADTAGGRDRVVGYGAFALVA